MLLTFHNQNTAVLYVKTRTLGHVLNLFHLGILMCVLTRSVDFRVHPVLSWKQKDTGILMCNVSRMPYVNFHKIS